MLRTIENAVRERKCLNGIWRFAVDRAGCGRDQRWWQSACPRRATCQFRRATTTLSRAVHFMTTLARCGIKPRRGCHAAGPTNALCSASTPLPTAPRSGWGIAKS